MTSTEKKKYFYPTKAEFRSFECYLQSLEKRSDRTGGIIIRPPDYYLDDIHLAHDEEQWASCPMKITVQSVEKADDSGVYLLSSYVKRGPRRKYAAMKEALVATTPAGEKSNYNDDDYHEIEAAYWNSPLIQQGGQVEYGSDNEGLIVPPTFEEGNLRQFRFLMRSLKSPRVIDGKVVESRTIPGLHTPYVYFGSRFSTFMMHTEDYDFPAINLHVAGSTKIWYTIDERYADRLEASVRAACRANGLAHAVKCTAFMRHKYFMVTPEFLRAHDIPYTVLCQNPGEIVVTFARVYHQGFNVGFNVNEAVNIATRVSMCHSARAKQCDCCESTKNRKTPVIDLKPVLRRLYGPEQCDKVENGTATFQDETDPLVIAKKKKAKDEIFTEKCEIFFQMTNEERRMAKHRLRPVIPEYAKAWVQHGPPALLSKPFYDRFKRSATIETKKLLAGVGHQTFVGSFRRFICDRIQRQPLEDLIEDADLRRAFQEKYTRSNRLTKAHKRRSNVDVSGSASTTSSEPNSRTIRQCRRHKIIVPSIDVDDIDLHTRLRCSNAFG